MKPPPLWNWNLHLVGQFCWQDLNHTVLNFSTLTNVHLVPAGGPCWASPGYICPLSLMRPLFFARQVGHINLPSLHAKHDHQPDKILGIDCTTILSPWTFLQSWHYYNNLIILFLVNNPVLKIRYLLSVQLSTVIPQICPHQLCLSKGRIMKVFSLLVLLDQESI